MDLDLPCIWMGHFPELSMQVVVVASGPFGPCPWGTLLAGTPGGHHIYYISRDAAFGPVRCRLALAWFGGNHTGPQQLLGLHREVFPSWVTRADTQGGLVA